MKFFPILLLMVVFFMSSCSCEEEGEEEKDKNNDPAWVSEQFYKAYCDQNYQEAEKYCDRQSQETLRSMYEWESMAPKQKFKSVDSCDQYEEHAYCYCSYEDDAEENQIEKLLLRKMKGDVWKVHFEKGNHYEGEDESPLYSKKVFKLRNAPDSLAEIDYLITEDAKEVTEHFVKVFNDEDFVVGFFKEFGMYSIDENAEKKYSYSDNYESRKHYSAWTLSQTYQFDVNDVLTGYEGKADVFEEENSYILFHLITVAFNEVFGKPYNSEEVEDEKWFQYEELRWFLKGYNEELIIHNDRSAIQVYLRQAY